MPAGDAKVQSSGDEAGDLIGQPSASAKIKGKSATERRAALPLPVWEFINPKGRCRRKILLGYLDDHKADTHASLPQPELYCNCCSPELRRYTPVPAKSSVLRRPRKCSPEAIAIEMIMEWCSAKSNELLPNAAFTVPPDIFLAEEVIIQLANACGDIRSMERLSTIVTPEWEWLDEHGEDLLKALKDISRQATEKWKASRSRKSDKRKVAQKERITAIPFEETSQQAVINSLFQDIGKMRERALIASTLPPPLQTSQIDHSASLPSQSEDSLQEPVDPQLLASVQSLHLE